MRRQKEGFAVPSDAEWSTYDVILLSSRLGARPNPLAFASISAFGIEFRPNHGQPETAPHCPSRYVIDIKIAQRV